MCNGWTLYIVVTVTRLLLMYVECLLGHVLVTVTSSLVRLWCDLLVEYRIEYLCITLVQ